MFSRVACTRIDRIVQSAAMAKTIATANRNGQPRRSNAHRSASTHDLARQPMQRTARLPVLKTYKIYIGGKFPRTESGRYYLLKNPRRQADRQHLPVQPQGFPRRRRRGARGAIGWAGDSAYNRGQILYRIAEMLEGAIAAVRLRTGRSSGVAASVAKTEVATAHRPRSSTTPAGPTNTSRSSASVNPVSSSHFNFSLLEPTGVVSILAPRRDRPDRARLHDRPRDRRRQHVHRAGFAPTCRCAPSRSPKCWRPATSPAAWSTSSPASAPS